MNDALVTLQKLESLLEESKTMDSRFRYGTFAAAKVIILSLQRRADKDEMSGYTLEKLGQLDGFVGAIFGMDDDFGHSVDQQYVWALTAINSLSGSLCFGREE